MTTFVKIANGPDSQHEVEVTGPGLKAFLLPGEATSVHIYGTQGLSVMEGRAVAKVEAAVVPLKTEPAAAPVERELEAA